MAEESSSSTTGLLQALASSNALLRQDAARGLSEQSARSDIGNEALPFLRAGLTDKDMLVRRHCALAIGRLASLKHIASKSKDGTAFGKKVGVDLSADPLLRAALIKSLSDRDPETREYAAASLGMGFIPAREIEEGLLARGRKEKHPQVLRVLLGALKRGRYSSPKTVKFLEKISRSGEGSLRPIAQGILKTIR
ncbi:MAG: HEAT repeat domain-containing protein [Elusimicrobiota bacterium]|jgi:HEAT repeat protein